MTSVKGFATLYWSSRGWSWLPPRIYVKTVRFQMTIEVLELSNGLLRHKRRQRFSLLRNSYIWISNSPVVLSSLEQIVEKIGVHEFSVRNVSSKYHLVSLQVSADLESKLLFLGALGKRLVQRIYAQILSLFQFIIIAELSEKRAYKPKPQCIMSRTPSRISKWFQKNASYSTMVNKSFFTQ